MDAMDQPLACVYLEDEAWMAMKRLTKDEARRILTEQKPNWTLEKPAGSIGHAWVVPGRCPASVPGP